MNHRSTGRISNNVSVPLTVKLPELTGPLPAVSTARAKDAPIRLVSRRGRRRSTPASVLAAIAADALAGTDGRANIVSVPPAVPGDPTLLFLRRKGKTQLMIAVSPGMIRSDRLRGDIRPRDREAERLFELFRVAEASGPFDCVEQDEEASVQLDDNL